MATKSRFSHFDSTPGCTVEAAVTLIDGKWKCGILYHLLGGTLRFNELRRRLTSATQRVLTAQLRELEADGLVLRTVFAEVPPRVEYQLSPLGYSLEPVLVAIEAWGKEHFYLFMGSDKRGKTTSEKLS